MVKPIPREGWDDKLSQRRLLKKEDHKIIILTRVWDKKCLSPPCRTGLDGKRAGEDGDEIELYISYYHGQRH